MKLNRRHFIKATGAGLALANFPSIIHATTTPRVIVIGGGFAGATVAKYIRMWSGQTVDVTLVDPKQQHTSCVLSNLILNKQLPLSQLKMSYTHLQSSYGVNVVRDRAVEINAPGNQVRLKRGGWQPYDKLVIATGIGFKKPNGLNSKQSPHAWIAGSQTKLLAKQLGNLNQDSHFIMTIPKSPYRCPPGPYERACLIADMFASKGYTSGDNPRVTVLDANTGIQAERDTFSRAFNNLYANVLEYIPNADVFSVDSSAGVVNTSAGEYQGDILNIIPQNRATGFVRKEGLTDGGNWAPVNPVTYESEFSEFQGIHIIGDSQNTSQPKSAHMANAQAKICADAILRSLYGLPTDTIERLDNITTNSACYSPITKNKASWLTANYRYNPDLETMELKHVGEAEKWDSENHKQMFVWASNLFTDCFG